MKSRHALALSVLCLAVTAWSTSAQAQTCTSGTMAESQPLMFARAGAVHFGPGTGMGMVGDSTFGVAYNLLFSGNWAARMAGNLNVAWPQALTLTTTGMPDGGYWELTFGLHMTVSLRLLGTTIPIDLSSVIADHMDTQHRTFTPWNMSPPSDHTMDPTMLHLDVSAWRNIITRTFTIAGQDVRVGVDVRYTMDATLETLEIGFPDPMGPTGMEPNLAQITGTMPMAMYPPPQNGGHLDLFTRWRPRINYYGMLEFRGTAELISCPLGLCVTLATHNLSTPPIAQGGSELAAPYDQRPGFDFPIEQIDQTEIDFGQVMLGSTVENSIGITNPGSAVLAPRVTGMADSAFTVGTVGCIAAGASGQIPVSFHPTSVGTFTSTVLVESNGITGSPTRVTLTGYGTTGSSHPPVTTDAGRDATVRLPDGAVVRADGGGTGEYRGSQADAGCGCSAPGSSSRSGPMTGLLVAGLGLAAAMARRSRRR